MECAKHWSQERVLGVSLVRSLQTLWAEGSPGWVKGRGQRPREASDLGVLPLRSYPQEKESTAGLPNLQPSGLTWNGKVHVPSHSFPNTISTSVVACHCRCATGRNPPKNTLAEGHGRGPAGIPAHPSGTVRTARLPFCSIAVSAIHTFTCTL